MVEKEIEQEYEVVETHTDTETVTFCDGCTEETDDYVTLSNASADCIKSIMAMVSRNEKCRRLGVDEGIGAHKSPEEAVEKALGDRLEEFHFCRGCQRGIREHGRTVDTSLYEPPEEEKDGTTSYLMHAAAMIAVLTSLVYWVGLAVGLLTGSVAAWSMVLASVALVVTLHVYRRL